MPVFGKLTKTYGEYRFRVSPYELKAYKGFFGDAVVKPFNRYIKDEWIFFTPPLLMAWMVYDWGEKTHDKLQRKNPKDYENDV